LSPLNKVSTLTLLSRITLSRSRSKTTPFSIKEEFNKIFKTLTDINIETLTNNIDAITSPDGIVSDKTSITEFINNVELKHVEVIRKKVVDMAVTGKLPPIDVESPEEDIKKGAPKTYPVPILFDNSDFFASQS